jgi:r-opsin
VCQLYGLTTGTAGLVTINTLAAISYDRYTVLCSLTNPHRHMTRPKVLAVIATVWFFSALWVTAPLAGWTRFTLEGIGTSCTFDYLTRDTQTKSYLLLLMTFNFALPLILIVYSYTRIFLAVAAVQRGLMMCTSDTAVLRNSVGGGSAIRRYNTELRTAKTILIIVGLFCVAWGPYCIVALIGLFGDAASVTPLVSALPCIFAKMATVANPPLYSIGNPKFRKKIAFLIKTSFRRHSADSLQGNSAGRVDAFPFATQMENLNTVANVLVPRAPNKTSSSASL